MCNNHASARRTISGHCILSFSVLKINQVNGRLVLDGMLRIHWGVQTSIKLKEKDDVENGTADTRDSYRRSYCMAMANGLDEDLLQVSVTSLS